MEHVFYCFFTCLCVSKEAELYKLFHLVCILPLEKKLKHVWNDGRVLVTSDFSQLKWN